MSVFFVGPGGAADAAGFGGSGLGGGGLHPAPGRTTGLRPPASAALSGTSSGRSDGDLDATAADGVGAGGGIWGVAVVSAAAAAGGVTGGTGWRGRTYVMYAQMATPPRSTPPKTASVRPRGLACISPEIEPL